jgi:DNA-binding LytR/AlgR family response regulator
VLGKVSERVLVDRLEQMMQQAQAPAVTHFYTKIGNKLRRINVEDIRYIEVEGKYSAINVGERKYNVKASLKDLLAKLPVAGFVRVSRNYVINIEHIDHIDTFQYTIRIADQEIPVSRTYKDNLMRHIQML